MTAPDPDFTLDASLLFVDLDDLDPAQLLSPADVPVPGEWLTMLVTALGDAFIQSGRDGRVYFLDRRAGSLEPIADHADALEALLEDPAFIDHYCEPDTIHALHAAGLTRAPHEVYTLRTPASAGGEWTLDNVVVVPVETVFAK